tara:strand:+ start:1126 stop:1566 length:441 start_codon:yes stop_codon:yes gene_type:complete
LPGKTRRYNVLFPVETLDALTRFADGIKISPAAFVRGAVAEALTPVSPSAEVDLNLPKEVVALVEAEALKVQVRPSHLLSIMVRRYLDNEYLPSKARKTSVPTSYADGVADACARVAKSARLVVRMTDGRTMGQDIADHIKKDLLG